MNIEKLPSGNFRITKQINGKRYRFTLDHRPNKHEIEEMVSDIKKESGTYSAKDTTFKDAFESYLQLKSAVLSPSTIKSYSSDYRQLSEDFTDLKINEIDQTIVQKEINTIAARVSPKTVRNVHGIISSVLKMFRPYLALATTLPQAKRIEMAIPEKDDCTTIIDAVRGTEYYVPFILAICGLRRSEIMAITADAIDGCNLHIHKAQVASLDGLTVKDNTKTTESTRHIIIPEDVAELIKKEGCAYKGHPNNLIRHLHRIQDQYGIKRFRFHDFRAYYASWAHAIGIPDQYIQEAAGWKSDYTMKKIYRRTMQKEYQESQKKYLNALGDLLGSE